MKYIYLGLVILASVSFAMAQTLSDHGANSTYSTRMPSYEEWAPSYLPYSGGVIFGKGEARFVVGSENDHERVGIGRLNVLFDRQEKLEIVVSGADQRFRLEAHNFVVCPMARHIARRAPIGFTVPPYINHSLFHQIGLLPYRGGFLANEFASDDRAAALISGADFWPGDGRRQRVAMWADVRAAILNHVDRVRVAVPRRDGVYIGLTYFIGDFHTSGVILLNTTTSEISIFGAPIVYYPEYSSDGRIHINDIEFLSSLPGDPLSDDGNYGSRDFKSLMDLSLIFAAIRDRAPNQLVEFIRTYC